MSQQETPKCPHCGVEMKKWRTPADSTWGTALFCSRLGLDDGVTEGEGIIQTPVES